MTWIMCETPPAESLCSVDGAAAEILRRQECIDVPVYSGGQASMCRIQGDVPEEYLILDTLGAGDTTFAGYEMWQGQVVLRAVAYTKGPARGMELIQCVQRSLISEKPIEFAGGIACLDRPAVPQQFDNLECTMVTQGQWTLAVVLYTGAL